MSQNDFEAGEGVLEITPPLGIEMAGYHKAPGNERRITGIRQPTFARALVLRLGRIEVAIVSLEVIGVSCAFAQRAQKLAARKTGIPAANIHLCATHSHSTPALRFMRQWGAMFGRCIGILSPAKVVEAVELGPSETLPGGHVCGQRSRCRRQLQSDLQNWKTDEKFDQNPRTNERWLDTSLHALYFLREKPRSSLVWYHFSRTPVCYSDSQAGPDWPGSGVSKAPDRDGLNPAYLQGHAGDVNPGKRQDVSR